MNLFDLNLTLPISDPTWVFFLVLIIILFAPTEVKDVSHHKLLRFFNGALSYVNV